jgi:hypothetical protein
MLYRKAPTKCGYSVGTSSSNMLSMSVDTVLTMRAFLASGIRKMASMINPIVSQLKA